MIQKKGLVFLSTALSLISFLFAVQPPLIAQDDSIDKYKRYRHSLVPLQKQMPDPGPNDWLTWHKEPGQTLEQYAAYRSPMQGPKPMIYLKGVGDLDKTDRLILEKVGEYLATFYQLEVVQLDTESLGVIQSEHTRERFGHTQLKTAHLFNNFLDQSPDQPYLGFLVFTDKDIYPEDRMNFVYGQAFYSARKGVTSLYRLRVTDDQGEVDIPRSVVRIAKTASHEIGHMIGINHCTSYSCGMNGANNLLETERQALHFCAECVNKVGWLLKLDLAERYEDLLSFMRKEGYTELQPFYDKAYKALLNQ